MSGFRSKKHASGKVSHFPTDNGSELSSKQLGVDERKREHFENKTASKLENAKRLAEKHRTLQKEGHAKHKEMSDMIPFGQPILVGHHSEGKHRRHIEKQHNLMKKTIEHGDKAEHFEKKVKNIEEGYAISSDDPDAVTKLKERVNEMLKEKEQWKNSVPNPNASHFDKDSPAMRRMHISSLTTNIRNTRKRIDKLNANRNIGESEEEINGTRIKVDQVENRVKIFFKDIPEPDIRTELKRSGFRWSPRNKAWQAFINPHAVSRAKEIVSKSN